MINLSSRILTEAEQKLLSKGLSFCPTTKMNNFTFETELFKYERQLKICEFFKNDSKAIGNPVRQFRLKSQFIPAGQYGSIEAYIKSIRADVLDIQKNKKLRYNLSQDERSAIKSLKEDVTILVKPADKGGAIVVMNYSDYRTGMLDMLSDTASYAEIKQNPTSLIQRKIEQYVEMGLTNQWINADVAAFLKINYPITPVIYGLPKIHKGTNPLKYRPIVAGSDSTTQPIAQWLDFYLQPLVKQLPSYLRDTGDFLDKLREYSPESNIMLVTMDISSLYTNIPNEAGCEAVRHFLTTTPVEIPSEYLLLGLDIVLNNNIFKFEKQYYQQIMGTAMGSAVAPSFANLFIGYLEERFIYTSELFKTCVCRWWRYIDDVMVIWKGGEDMFNKFVIELNGIYSTIKFNPEHSHVSIPFLDVLIKVDEKGNLTTSLYNKPTDRNTILRYDSAHPRHLTDNLPISQFLRVLRICSEEDDRALQLEKMTKKFQERGYPEDIIENARRKALLISTEGTANRPKKSGNQTLFVQTFTTMSEHIKKCTNRHNHILKADKNLGRGVKEKPLHVYRRNQSLRDQLVRADPVEKYTKKAYSFSKKTGCYRCNNCNVCNSLITGSTFQHPHLGTPYTIKEFFSCNTEFCVYLLKCPCSMYYVGKTTGPFKRRFQKHRSDVKIQKQKFDKDGSMDLDKPVAVHFIKQNHQVHEMKGMVIEHVPPLNRGGDRNRRLLQRESFWIYTLDTVTPRGLNINFGFHCYLPTR